MNSFELSANIDELGIVKAKIAELQKIESELKGKLVDAMGVGTRADGGLFQALIVSVETERLDQAKVRKFLHPNQLRAATVLSTSVQVRISAKKFVPESTLA